MQFYWIEIMDECGTKYDQNRCMNYMFEISSFKHRLGNSEIKHQVNFTPQIVIHRVMRSSFRNVCFFFPTIVPRLGLITSAENAYINFWWLVYYHNKTIECFHPRWFIVHLITWCFITYYCSGFVLDLGSKF